MRRHFSTAAFVVVVLAGVGAAGLGAIELAVRSTWLRSKVTAAVVQGLGLPTSIRVTPATIFQRLHPEALWAFTDPLR